MMKQRTQVQTVQWRNDILFSHLMVHFTRQNYVISIFPKHTHTYTHTQSHRRTHRETWPGGRQWSSTRVVPQSSQPAWVTLNTSQPRENNGNRCVSCLSSAHALAQDEEQRLDEHPTAPPSDCHLLWAFYHAVNAYLYQCVIMYISGYMVPKSKSVML